MTIIKNIWYFGNAFVSFVCLFLPAISWDTQDKHCYPHFMDEERNEQTQYHVCGNYSINIFWMNSTTGDCWNFLKNPGCNLKLKHHPPTHKKGLKLRK